MNWITKIAVASTIALSGLPFSAQSPVQAQSCTPLRVVEGTGTQVEKTVSLPGTLTTRSNWNTDFSVPNGRSFRRYVATFTPRNSGNYTVQMSLKYANNTSGEVYDQTATFEQGRSYTISGAPRLNATPYQVNVSVGGVPVTGNTYILSVAGCN
jgi:hypothetical protein